VAVAPPPVAPEVAEAADLVSSALADLDGDLGELAFLCSAGQDRLGELEAVLRVACPHAETREFLARSVASARRRYRALSGRVRVLRAEARSAPPTRLLVSRLTAERAALADRLRTEQSVLAGLVAAPDWQSPSFLHSRSPAVGRHVGRIRAHWNDYRRDRHIDAEAYETRYVEEMVDGGGGLRALLTGGGMAAFTTILWWLLAEEKLSGRLLVGRGVYHESRWLLERMLPDRVCLVDESDTAGLLAALDQVRPRAVFLDALSNSSAMPMPDLAAVIARLRGTDTYLVVDNTSLSVGGQAFALAGSDVRIVVFESLLKYGQFGMDRANAGLIVASVRDAGALDRYREHLGTNVPDVSVHALPPPDRRVLVRRLARLERNALHLARCLDERAPPGVALVYPGIGAHRGSMGGGRVPFRGGCVSVLFRQHGGVLERQRRLVEAAVDEATRRGIRLHAGSSLGFDTTRIYVTAAGAEHGTPFVRIAAGTEHCLELAALTDALAAALRAAIEAEA
jgi:cystathionine beta-lyase/cystathionine gamma-synthase